MLGQPWLRSRQPGLGGGTTAGWWHTGSLAKGPSREGLGAPGGSAVALPAAAQQRGEADGASGTHPSLTYSSAPG